MVHDYHYDTLNRLAIRATTDRNVVYVREYTGMQQGSVGNLWQEIEAKVPQVLNAPADHRNILVHATDNILSQPNAISDVAAGAKYIADKWKISVMVISNYGEQIYHQ